MSDINNSERRITELEEARDFYQDCYIKQLLRTTELEAQLAATSKPLAVKFLGSTYGHPDETPEDRAKRHIEIVERFARSSQNT